MQKSEHAISLTNNVTGQLWLATNLGEDHIVQLQRASVQASSLLVKVDKIALSAESLFAKLTAWLFPNIGGVPWLVLVVSAFALSWLGSLGLPPSLMRNLVMLAIGKWFV